MIFKKEFFFLRHGETDFNAKKILPTENIDISLNQKGRQQARNVKFILDNVSFKTICHSPMKRVKETMELAFEGYDMVKFEIEELRECCYETWIEMTTFVANQQQTKKVSDFFIKTIQGINKALAQPGPVIIIAHGGIHWALCVQLNITSHCWDIDNCRLVHFKPVESGWNASIIS
jgi:probable phosphoglycerate mutase